MPSYTSPFPIVPPSSARGLLHAMEERGLIQHAVAVCTLTAAVCGRLGMSARPSELIATAGLLHDVGKLALPSAVLDHPGRLTEDDWQLIRDHPTIGARTLRLVPGLEATAPLVRHSHERWDGYGYPDGLAAGLIPMGSRIIAACDAWDAMTSDRVYRSALTRDEALDALMTGAGAQFDVDVVAALIAVVSRRPTAA